MDVGKSMKATMDTFTSAVIVGNLKSTAKNAKKSTVKGVPNKSTLKGTR